MPSVLFVSKPVDPPINDGSKHLVLTLANRLTRYVPRVMTTRGGAAFGDAIQVDAIYGAANSYAPSLFNNLRAARHLVTAADCDLWNFVFAPNRRSSKMGRWLKLLRQIPVVQTIASQPRSFESPGDLLFGDVVVAQSRFTRQRLERALSTPTGGGGCPRIEVIFPPLGDLRIPSLDDTSAVRHSLDVGPDVPLLLYPGDLEVSHGARIVKGAAVVVAERHPSAVVVFAYRDKTPAAAEAAERLMRDLNPKRVRFVREAKDILAVVRTSAAVLFPVDDLYGKVDIPIILLQAMALGTPIVTYRHGPLADLEGVESVGVGDPLALADTAVALIDDHGRRNHCIEQQLQTVAHNHDASRAAAAYEALYDELLSNSRKRGSS